MTGHAVGHDEALISRLRDENLWLRSIVELLIASRSRLSEPGAEARPDPPLPDPAASPAERRARRTQPGPNDHGRALAELEADGRRRPRRVDGAA